MSDEIKTMPAHARDGFRAIPAGRPSIPAPIPPRTLLRLVRLWPRARKRGYDRGQLYRVGYYCRHCGRDLIWLVDRSGNYDWTVDRGFVLRHFEVVEISRERSLYGKGKPPIEPLPE